jgi:hypothetical protein
MDLVHYLLKLGGASPSAVEFGGRGTLVGLGDTLLAQGGEGPSLEGRLGPRIEEPLQMLFVATRRSHPSDALLGREVLDLKGLWCL